jgi:ABC-type hemin transport system substrate-binding protein
MLGAGDRLVGRTDYCVEPPRRWSAVPSVGGTKDADVDAIVALAPDLVLVNQEENTEAIHRDLTARGIAVHLSFPKTVADAVTLQHDLAALLGARPRRTRCSRLRAAVAEAERDARARGHVRVFCPIWMDPLMTVHGDTFISDVLDLCGGANVLPTARGAIPSRPTSAAPPRGAPNAWAHAIRATPG